MREIILLVPILLYMAIVMGFLWVFQKTRKTRWPFRDEDRLLRGPGESLHQRIKELDQTLLFELLWGIVTTLLLSGATFSVGVYLNFSLVQGITAIVLVGIGISAIAALRVLRLLRERRAYHLGWFGERVVAEKLAPLRFAGWQVFHDVPFVSNGQNFNIDHIVVGEGGLFTLETKSRRKGGGSDPKFDGEVVFDGQALHWPRFKGDESGLKQAEWNALELTRWLKEEIGERVHASPILVIPGWSVKFSISGKRRLCRVESANWIQNHFKDRTPCLSRNTVELVARRLRARCKDVKD